MATTFETLMDKAVAGTLVLAETNIRSAGLSDTQRATLVATLLASQTDLSALATDIEPLLLATDPISLANASLTITGDLTSDGSTAVTFPVIAQVSSGLWENAGDYADDVTGSVYHVATDAGWTYTGAILAGTAVFTPLFAATGTPIPSLNTTLGAPGQRAIVDDGTNPVRHFYNAKIADGDADNWVLVASQTDVDAKVSLTDDETIAGNKTFSGPTALADVDISGVGTMASHDMSDPEALITREMLEAYTGKKIRVDTTVYTYTETISTIDIDITPFMSGNATANLLEVEIIGGTGILLNTGRFWRKKYLIQFRRVNSATAIEVIELESNIGSFHAVSTNLPILSFSAVVGILKLDISDTAGGATTGKIEKITTSSHFVTPLTLT